MGRLTENSVINVKNKSETTDIGRDTASPVRGDYTPTGSVFNGTVNWVQIDIAESAADDDHQLSAEERMRVAIARQ